MISVPAVCMKYTDSSGKRLFDETGFQKWWKLLQSIGFTHFLNMYVNTKLYVQYLYSNVYPPHTNSVKAIPAYFQHLCHALCLYVNHFDVHNDSMLIKRRCRNKK